MFYVLETVIQYCELAWMRFNHITSSWCNIDEKIFVGWYCFVLNCRGKSNKMHQRENYQDLLNWAGGVFKSFSYNNQLNLRFFPKIWNFIPSLELSPKELNNFFKLMTDDVALYWKINSFSFSRVLFRIFNISHDFSDLLYCNELLFLLRVFTCHSCQPPQSQKFWHKLKNSFFVCHSVSSQNP